jgi:hypothetical protein
MTIHYEKEQIKYANEHHLKLCTLAIPGMTFQGPCTVEETKVIADCMIKIQDMRCARFSAVNENAVIKD